MHIESLETRVQFSGGIVSSSSSTGIRPSFAIGIAETSEFPYAETFFGQPVDGTAVLIRYVMPGDPTLDGKIDRADVRVLVTNFNQPGGYTKGDSNYDGFIRIVDFAMMAQRANELAG
jgi:hypothetical protein